MRDSRIGTYGAIALGLSLLIRISALAALERPHLVLIALVGAAMAGRGGMIVPLLILSPARADGMAAGMGACSALERRSWARLGRLGPAVPSADRRRVRCRHRFCRGGFCV